jgi:hypothetical protein
MLVPTGRTHIPFLPRRTIVWDTRNSLGRLHHESGPLAILTNAIETNMPLGLTKPSDLAAIERIRGVLSAPHERLHDIQSHATRALLRLYRQRNLVLHWGKTDAVALRASLRTAAPLVGAGMDRIAHAWFVQKIRPLELAARARMALAVIGSRPGSSCLDLLA